MLVLTCFFFSFFKGYNKHLFFFLFLLFFLLVHHITFLSIFCNLCDKMRQNIIFDFLLFLLPATSLSLLHLLISVFKSKEMKTHKNIYLYIYTLLSMEMKITLFLCNFGNIVLHFFCLEVIS